MKGSHLITRITGGPSARQELDEVREQRDVAEAVAREATRELGMLGYTLMDFTAGQPQELRAETRRAWAQKARVAWLSDAMAGASVDLMNDFCFGRGVPRPRAKDSEVQKVIDEFWDDPDNKRVLTTYEAQMSLGTDLTLQSNLFMLMFDEGDDGKVKLALLNHDDVVDAVSDPEFRQRVLYYLAHHKKTEWDFKNDCVKLDLTGGLQPKKLYYEHWSLQSEPENYERDLPKPPAEKMGDGRVYHVRMNRTSEMIFGAPTMQRTLRWFNAYNRFMTSRVNIAEAAAAFVMKRKVTGTPTQVARMASKAISRASDLSAATGVPGDTQAQLPPRSGAILNENENVTHEAFKIPSGAGEASEDAMMLRAQVSAATRWPQHYLGDAGSANLATATAMELPVLKAVESRQELFRQLFVWGIDRAIERAVDSGRLDPNTATVTDPAYDDTRIGEAHEGASADESSTERDLSYEFQLPSPLRRTMIDLVSAACQVAQVFDPNNTNPDLSRILLAVIFGQGFEMEDPADAVERAFPEGYEDPAVTAAKQAAQAQQDFMQQQQDAMGGAGGGFGTNGAGQQSAGAQALGGDTTYGAKGGAVPADQQRIQQAALRRRDGEPVLGLDLGLDLGEGHRTDDGDERVEAAVVGRGRALDDDFVDVELAAANALGELVAANGKQTE